MSPRFTFTFIAALYEHGSWGARDIAGRHACTMEFYEGKDAGHASIEWDIPSLDRSEGIGLVFEMRDGARTLIDYDGISMLPAQAIRVLQHIGITVPRGEGLDEEIDASCELKGEEMPVVRTQSEAQAYLERNGERLTKAIANQ